MPVDQKYIDWEAAAIKLQKQLLDLSSQCVATKRIFESLAQEDSQFSSVIFGRWLEFFHEEMTRQMVILEDNVGPARAAEFDKDRKLYELPLA